MTCIAVRCPHGDSKQSVTRRKMPRGIQRSLCQSTAWARGSLFLDSCNQGGVPEVKPHSLAMRLHASGGRDTARVLRISPETALCALTKKAAVLESVNTALRRTRTPDERAVDLQRAGAATMGDLGRFVGKKGQQRWGWHAIDHHTGPSWRRSVGTDKTRAFCSATRCWRLAASPRVYS